MEKTKKMKYRIYEMNEEGKTNYCIYAIGGWKESYTGLRFPTRLEAEERLNKLTEGYENGKSN